MRRAPLDPQMSEERRGTVPLVSTSEHEVADPDDISAPRMRALRHRRAPSPGQHRDSQYAICLSLTLGEGRCLHSLAQEGETMRDDLSNKHNKTPRNRSLYSKKIKISAELLLNLIRLHGRRRPCHCNTASYVQGGNNTLNLSRERARAHIQKTHACTCTCTYT